MAAAKRCIFTIAVAVSLAAALAYGQSGDIRVLPVRGNIFVLTGGGSNVVASVGRDAVLLVDTGNAAMSGKMLAAVQALSRQVTAAGTPQQSCVGNTGCTWWDGSRFLSTTMAPRAPRPITGIINTSFDADHMGGNAVLSTAGSSFGGARQGPGAWILTHENGPTHARKSAPVPADAMPTETYIGTEKKLNFFNGEGVVVWHRPAALRPTAGTCSGSPADEGRPSFASSR